MSTVRYDENIGDALALVNVAREAFGKPLLTDLPDSRAGNPTDCLFYRGLADLGVTSVGVGSMDFSSERTAAFVADLWGAKRTGNTVHHPRQLTETITAFDKHEFRSRYEV